MKRRTGLLLFVAIGAVAAGGALARDCRVPHLPGKNPAKPPPGCDMPAKSRHDAGSRLREEDGFVDLGNGTKVRIGGRVRIEIGGRP